MEKELDAVYHKIEVPLYEIEMHVVFASSVEEAMRYAIKQNPDYLDDDDLDNAKRTAGMVQDVDSRPWVLLPYNAEINTVAHEAVHAAFSIYEIAQVRTGATNQEPLAYLVGWLTGRLAELQMDILEEFAQAKAEIRKKIGSAMANASVGTLA